MIKTLKSSFGRPYSSWKSEPNDRENVSPVLKVPPELWHQILYEFVEDQPVWGRRTTLVSLSRTCRYIHDVVEPILYSSLCIVFHPSWTSSISCVEQLESKPHLVPAVRRLVIHGGSLDKHLRLSLSGGGANMGVKLHKLYCLIPRMTGLRQLTCIRTLLFPSLRRAVLTHPALPKITMLGSRGVASSRLPVLDSEEDGLQHYRGYHDGSIHSSLQTFETDSAALISPILLRPRASHIGRLSVEICYSEDRMALSELLEHCVNIQYLSLTGVEYDMLFSATSLPNLRAFKGHPCVAARVVPHRPISELELLPNNFGDWVAYDLNYIPAAIRAAMMSTVPLQLLSITMYDAHQEVLRDILREAFPNLSTLRLEFRNANVELFEVTKTVLESAVLALVESCQRLSEFDMHWKNSVVFGDSSWEDWEPVVVRELVRRCPSLRVIRLRSYWGWVLSDDVLKKVPVSREGNNDNFIDVMVMAKGPLDGLPARWEGALRNFLRNPFSSF